MPVLTTVLDRYIGVISELVFVADTYGVQGKVISTLPAIRNTLEVAVVSHVQQEAGGLFLSKLGIYRTRNTSSSTAID